MARLFFILAFAFGSAFAELPLSQRVADEIRAYALLPDAADVRIMQMTPVRGAVEAIEISRYDRLTGQFQAVIGYGERRAAISGRAGVTVPVVVASRTLRRGAMIEASDVEIRQVSVAQVPASSYLITEDVVGTSARRSLAAGRPIREDDVGLPIIMRKNEAIEIVYETQAMTLVARGRALDEGARGDFIRVVTDGQGLTVSGEIAAPGRVVVR